MIQVPVLLIPSVALCFLSLAAFPLNILDRCDARERLNYLGKGELMKKVKTYCFQCYNGPDPFHMVVEGDMVRHIEPDFDCAGISPGEGRVCVKAYGLVQKMYNSNRIKTPLIQGDLLGRGL